MLQAQLPAAAAAAAAVASAVTVIRGASNARQNRAKTRDLLKL